MLSESFLRTAQQLLSWRTMLQSDPRRSTVWRDLADRVWRVISSSAERLDPDWANPGQSLALSRAASIYFEHLIDVQQDAGVQDL